MRTVRDPTWKSLIADMERARNQVEREEYPDAAAALLKLRAELARQGMRSAHVSWSLAVVADCQGEHEQAFNYIREALELDPLSLPYGRSYDLIVENIRKTVGNETTAPTSPDTPRLYELLVRVNETDAACHLSMARWHFKAGAPQAAMRLLDALTTLAPASLPAWMLKAEVARAMGEFEIAKNADFEATALERYESVSHGLPPKNLA